MKSYDELTNLLDEQHSLILWQQEELKKAVLLIKDREAEIINLTKKLKIKDDKLNSLKIIIDKLNYNVSSCVLLYNE